MFLFLSFLPWCFRNMHFDAIIVQLLNLPILYIALSDFKEYPFSLLKSLKIKTLRTSFNHPFLEGGSLWYLS